MKNDLDDRSKRIEALLEIKRINESGYAGILPNGNIVDRRKYPHAIAIQRNELFDVPEPKSL